MEVTGKIILALPEMSGTSKAGNAWKKREYVLETQEQYPKKIHFDFFTGHNLNILLIYLIKHINNRHLIPPK